MNSRSWSYDNYDNSGNCEYVESPSRFYSRSLCSSVTDLEVDSAVQRALEYSSDWRSVNDSDELSDNVQLSEKDVISNMAN